MRSELLSNSPAALEGAQDKLSIVSSCTTVEVALGTSLPDTFASRQAAVQAFLGKGQTNIASWHCSMYLD